MKDHRCSYISGNMNDEKSYYCKKTGKKVFECYQCKFFCDQWEKVFGKGARNESNG